MDTTVLSLEQELLSDLDNLNLVIKDQSTLEQVAETLEGKEELDSIAIEMFSVCTKSLYNRLGIKKHHKAYISLESISSSDYKLAYAKESVNIALEGIGKAIMDFLRLISRKFLEFIKWVTGNAEEVKEKKQEEDLKKETQNAKETPQTEENFNDFKAKKSNKNKAKLLPDKASKLNTGKKDDTANKDQKEIDSSEDVEDLTNALNLQDNEKSKDKLLTVFKINDKLQGLSKKIAFESMKSCEELRHYHLSHIIEKSFDVVENLKDLIVMSSNEFKFIEERLNNAINSKDEEDDGVAIKLLEATELTYDKKTNNNIQKLENYLFSFQEIEESGPFGKLKDGNNTEYFLVRNSANEVSYRMKYENNQFNLIAQIAEPCSNEVSFSYIKKTERLKLINYLTHIREQVKFCYKKSSELQKQIEQFTKKFESIKINNDENGNKTKYINKAIKFYIGYINVNISMIVKTLMLLKNQNRILILYFGYMNKFANALDTDN